MPNLQRLAVLALLVAVSACGSGDGRAVEIVNAEVESDFTTLHLGLDVCNGSLPYSVDESGPDDIKIGVHATAEDPGECPDRLTLILRSTLDNRRLIDTSTGDAVEVRVQEN
ncbi:MAG TPA: hypothetical protein VGW38_05180 [Chloroflexota bacterium]|nr:hypothetical protein [Chloroflexota bacterium]